MEIKQEIFYPSPIGLLKIKADSTGIYQLAFSTEDYQKNPINLSEENSTHRAKGSSLLNQATKQLDDYFNGDRLFFDLTLHLQASPFQQKVWRALMDIPYGQTATYQEIAQQIGQPKAYRAVGLANHKNPIPIVIACHRVIGKNGKMTGYAGGIWRKQWLLAHERKNN